VCYPSVHLVEIDCISRSRANCHAFAHDFTRVAPLRLNSGSWAAGLWWPANLCLTPSGLPPELARRAVTRLRVDEIDPVDGYLHHAWVSSTRLPCSFPANCIVPSATSLTMSPYSLIFYTSSRLLFARTYSKSRCANQIPVMNTRAPRLAT